ncbi:MAG: hypothetical protein ACFCVE_03055 [Phycisphaerae bacterium]
MSESTGLLNRIGNLFRRTKPDGDDVRVVGPDHDHDGHRHEANGEGGPDMAGTDMSGTDLAAAGSFLRPWAKRDAAIQQLQAGIGHLNDLMTGIRDNLETQSERQTRMLEVLSQLPELLEKNADAGQEQLEAIREELSRHGDTQAGIGKVLDKLEQGGTAQRETIQELQGRFEAIRETDERMTRSLDNVGSTLQSYSRSSAASTSVLEQMRDAMDAQNREMERTLKKQGGRQTALLLVAIIMSALAIAAVAGLGWMILRQAGG